jgi:arsenate reductase (thioredoxin)
MTKPRTIVFVCEHGAAKSVIAAACFNKLAGESGLKLRAMARGTDPDSELSAKAIAGLHEDGLTPTESFPQKLSMEDIEFAQRIITFCKLPKEYQQIRIVEQWDDVPPVSENYETARDAIVERINQLIKNIA